MQEDTPAAPYRVALWGDLPYNGDSIDVFDPTTTYGPIYRELSNTINAFNPVFSIHAGDVKSGGGSCGELNYRRFQDLVNSFNHPAFLSLGDNGWTDCHRLSNGNYDPLERLDYMRGRFYDQSGKGKGKGKGKTGRTAETILGTGEFKYNTFDGDYPELHWWIYGDVMYVNAHIVGSNNGLYDGVDRSCDPYLSMIDPGCMMAIEESKKRTMVVNELVSAAFEIAKKEGLAGVLVTMQANIFGGPCNADFSVCDINQPVSISNGFTDFWENLVEETLEFGKPVALFHGDFHYYQVFPNPDGRAPNLVAVQCPGSGDVGWVSLEVDPSSPEVFTFAHVDNTP